ncbi:MAG: hypothetical protein OHK0028_19160 [Deltaproteobacteria bacterium]
MDGEWRCRRCGKLLGVREGSRLQLRIGRRHQYLVAPPVTAACWNCGALNEYPLGQPETISKPTR